MKSWTIGTKIAVTSASGALFMVLIAVAGYSGIRGGQGAGVASLISALLGGLAALGILAFWTIRSTNQSVRRSAEAIRTGTEQVVSASSQVASSSEHLAQGASEQAATVEETSASCREIEAMTRRNAENAGNAAELMRAMDEGVSRVNKRLSQMLASMGEITASSDRIAKIIKVIDEIAFQTNILALNAAVEAARAGDAGLGFAVVADEVRSLAQRCAQAAKDTTALIDDSVRNAQTGSERLNEVTTVVEEITRGAGSVKVLISEVSHGAAEQTNGIEQILKALVQMEQVTQNIAASAEEGSSASRELQGQAQAMGSVVDTLESLVQSARPKPVPAKAKVQQRIEKSTTRGLTALTKAVGSRTTTVTFAPPVKKKEPSFEEQLPLEEGEFSRF